MTIRLPQFIRHDLARKLVALLAAVLIWLYVDNQLHEVERFNDVPVELRHDEAAISLGKAAAAVNVSLRGSRQRLQGIKSSDIRIRAEVPVVPKGIYFYELRLTPDNVRVPSGTRVAEISPATLMVPVDRLETRRDVPVRVRFSGRLRDGFQTGKVGVVPSTVDLRGPTKLLEETREVVTEPVPLDDTVTQGFEVEARLVAPLRVAPSIETAHVTVDVGRQTVRQAYKDLPLGVLGGADRVLTLQEPLPPVSVTLLGNQAVLETIDSFALRPFVDISGIAGPGRYRRPVQVWVGGLAGVTVEYIHPSMVEVVLDHVPAGK